MANACVFSPKDKQGNPYKALSEYKKELGQQTGSEAFLIALAPSFQEKYKSTLKIDSQGVATLDTAMKTAEIKDLIGFETIKEKIEKEQGFIALPDTADNFKLLINEAKNFNDKNEDYIVYPEVSEGKIKNTAHKRNADSVETFNNLYGSHVLNTTLLDMFSPLGLTPALLTEAESGYSGIVDFSKAKGIAGEFANLIRVSNDMEGQKSMSEEFSHVIIRMLKGRPLIQRVLASLVSSPEKMSKVLGDDYALYEQNATDKDGNIDYDSIAEECLGRLLQKELLNNVQEKQDKSYFNNLWQRAYTFIKNLFKGFNSSDIEKAIIDADQTIGDLAKKLLQGDIQFKREDIESLKKYKDKLYHLNETVDFLNKVVEDAITVETKKTRILKHEGAVERANKKRQNLKAILRGTPEGKLKGIINYAHNAVNDLGAAREALLNSKEDARNFAMLRGIRSTIQSYNDFIDQIETIINSKDEELQKLVIETSIEDKHHTTVKLREACKELVELRDNVLSMFKDVALDAVEEFLKPFFGVEGELTDITGQKTTLRNLIEKANTDINFVDRYFMTMSNSGDYLLQVFDAVVKKAKANARYNTIEDMHDIIKLMLDAEDLGIKDFDWMYEKDSEGHKTGNYISAINVGQFEKDKKEFFAKLDEKYGTNPTGSKAKEKIREKREWILSHSNILGTAPNTDVYHNTEFDRLSSAQKDILERYLTIKQKCDRRVPSSKVSTIKAIQMRRTSEQRTIDSLMNPSQAFENVKESIKKELTKTEDDENIYGVKTGLRSFDGSEFMVLPVLYTTRLSNPDELTGDVFSALASYSYSTNLYEEMDKVVDPLEVAKSWVYDYRKTAKTSNDKALVEKMGKIVAPIYKEKGVNSIEKLDDFMESQVYMRYYKDSDSTVNLMGKEVKAGKLVDKWLSISSMVQLGFNALAHLGNVATGSAMQHIEACCGHYFNAANLLKADAIYAKELMTFLPEIESKNPKSKLALFDQLFDIKQEFAGNIKNQMNTIMEKVFNKSIAFLGQTCGDHWLYNRTAIAMCLKQKVKLPDGTITSLWDALNVRNVFENEDRIKELVIDAVDAETGKPIDKEYIRKFSAKINEVNHRLFGVYNTDDMVAAQRVSLGRCVLQYRQWIVPMFARRFQSRRFVEALDEYEEGYYVTALHVLAGLRNGIGGLMEVYDELDANQKANIIRVIAEISQFMIIWAIANFCSFGKDDPKRSWTMKLAEYMAQRELHELGNLTPSFVMGNELLKTVKSPATILNTTQAAFDFVASLFDPRDWNDIIESGKYEGMSTLHKNFLKAPFTVLTPFKQYDRAVENIDDVTRYYARPQ